MKKILLIISLLPILLYAQMNECDKYVGEEISFKKIDSAKAIEVCLKSVKNDPNNMKYIAQLGRAYNKNKNATKAAELYKKSCDGGYTRGCAHLGNMYNFGKGVKEDKSKAVELYKKSCDGGYAPGCAHLGICIILVKV